MTDNIVKAATLFKDCLKYEGAKLLFDLELCTAYYCPAISHMHRTVWVEENLLLFYPTQENIAGDVLREHNPHRQVYFCPVGIDADINREFINEASYFLKIDEPLPPALMPINFVIAGSDLSRVFNLMVFS